MVPYADLMSTLVILFLALFAMSYSDRSLELENLVAQVESKMASGAQAAPARERLHEVDVAEQIQQAMKGLALRDFGVTVDSRYVRLRLPAPVLFSEGSDRINPDAAPLLRALGRLFSQVPNPILVEGFTDDVPVVGGRFHDNWKPGLVRPRAVRRSLLGGRDRASRGEVLHPRLRAIPPSRLERRRGGPLGQPAHRDQPDPGNAKGRTLGVVLVPLLAIGLVVSAQEAANPLPKVIQEQYQEAFQFYSSGQYQKAVLKWEQILQEDHAQASARTMIEKARRTIWRLTRDKQKELSEMVLRGQYQKAQVALQPLLDLDPDDPKLEGFRQRLQNVVEIAPALAGDSRASRAAVRGMAGYLDFDPDYQLAYDGLRYALELTADDDLYQRLEDLVLSEQPQLAKDAVTPGMTLMAYKQHIALSDIYDGRYSHAISVLVEILRLEPNNVTGWERLGSAYFCLGLKAKAAAAWKEALKLSPNDPSLKKFLTRKRPLKCGR